ARRPERIFCGPVNPPSPHPLPSQAWWRRPSVYVELKVMATVAGPLTQERAAPERLISWTALAWFSALLIGAYYPILVKLVLQWSTDEDVGHGFFVPVVAGYIAWQRREQLLALPRKPAWWGLGLLAWGALQAWIGMLGAELFLQRSAFL